MQNQKPHYVEAVKEIGILTAAVAIIAAAVFFFLVPSHTSKNVSVLFGKCVVTKSSMMDFWFSIDTLSRSSSSSTEMRAYPAMSKRSIICIHP